MGSLFIFRGNIISYYANINVFYKKETIIMKTYFIEARTLNESIKVKKVLDGYDLLKLQRNKGITIYETYSFKTSKKDWKEIKKKLNLEKKAVFAQIKES